MNFQIKSKISSNELNKQIERHLQELANKTDKARTSEEMIRYLDFCAKFHQYSAGNIWLILMANPDASYVAGYQSWKTMGRWVKRGEHGIPILAPVLEKEEDGDIGEEQYLVGFRVVHVFDFAQTDGDPIPPVPNWKSPEKNLELQTKLIEFAKTRRIKVTIEKLEGDTQGISKGGSIVLSPQAGTKTLIHEIAHELLHKDEYSQLSRAKKEMEAEVVGYIVSRSFGLDKLASPNYLILQGVSPRLIIDDCERIKRYASKIIKYVIRKPD